MLEKRWGRIIDFAGMNAVQECIGRAQVSHLSTQPGPDLLGARQRVRSNGQRYRLGHFVNGQMTRLMAEPDFVSGERVSIGSRTVPAVTPAKRQLTLRFRTKSLQRGSRQFRAGPLR